MHKKGRITQGIGGLYHVDTIDGIYFCKPRGIFRKQEIEPIVGDFVEIEVISDDINEATITKIQPRANQLLRPKVSNIDQSILVFSCTSPPMNVDLLDRLIILSEEQELEIVIVLNKADKPASVKKMNSIKLEYEKIGYTVIYTSAIKGQGIDQLHAMLAGKVSVFCGASGVGKSSLVNFIYPQANMGVGQISQKGKRGKHTTRFSRLIKIEDGSDGFIVDSPGFSSLAFNFEKSRLAHYFKEFTPFLESCRFADCHHLQEPGCQIKENVGTVISYERYIRYKKLYEELQ
ncbi:MAG: ribosome small subunit-dependent GTPase A [Defluviitaleaceae bacterium]|nr:ribosome small subunit-dependent GTPase A [Defluviitaleaceae bacterium]